MFLVGKRFRLRNKVIVVGNAVINKDVLNTLSNNFDVISLSPKDFKDKLTDFQKYNCYLDSFRYFPRK